MTKPIHEEATDIIHAFKPRRAFRRAHAGARCGMCGLGITAVDFVLVVIEIDGFKQEPRPIHNKCTSFLMELAEELRAQNSE